MIADFIGRTTELSVLQKRFTQVASSGSGLALAIRGRRQVGKSRLVQEFCDASGAPYVFFTAIKGASPVEAITGFRSALAESTLPADPDLIPETTTAQWTDAFRILATALPNKPSVVVLDELPWLAEQDETFDGALQVAWDRQLSRRPVLLLLLGSDIHMMERLTAYDRPFYGRADTLLLGPLNPAETGQATGLAGSDAIDAHLVSGGLPGILRRWPHGTPALPFIADECADPAAPVFSVPEATLLAEFPTPDHARRVLEAIGSGDRTFSNIAAAAGGRQGQLPSGSLSPLLRRLVEEKHVVSIDEPLSTVPGKPALYRVADSNLRFYLAALRSAQELARRGQAAAAFQLVERRWSTWRGRAVEPLVRQALELAFGAGNDPWPELVHVGGWWNRQFNPEVDLVGVDLAPVARTIFFAGSIKWLASAFDHRDYAALAAGAAQIPGFRDDGALAAVSLSGINDVDADDLALRWNADDVLAAWQY